jgi:hypothetical protein
LLVPRILQYSLKITAFVGAGRRAIDPLREALT